MPFIHLPAVVERRMWRDPEIDRIWAEEARKRWEAYKTGKLELVSYDQVMRKHKHK